MYIYYIYIYIYIYYIYIILYIIYMYCIIYIILYIILYIYIYIYFFSASNDFSQYIHSICFVSCLFCLGKSFRFLH